MSVLNDIPFLTYSPKHFTQINRAQYGNAMLVLIRMGTSMAAGNQRKHLTLHSATIKRLLFYELVYKHINIFPNTWTVLDCKNLSKRPFFQGGQFCHGVIAMSRLAEILKIQHAILSNAKDIMCFKTCEKIYFLRFLPRGDHTNLADQWNFDFRIGHFTGVCLKTKPLSGSEAQGDLVLIQTLLPLICKSFSCYANLFLVSIMSRSP